MYKKYLISTASLSDSNLSALTNYLSTFTSFISLKQMFLIKSLMTAEQIKNNIDLILLSDSESVIMIMEIPEDLTNISLTIASNQVNKDPNIFNNFSIN